MWIRGVRYCALQKNAVADVRFTPESGHSSMSALRTAIAGSGESSRAIGVGWMASAHNHHIPPRAPSFLPHWAQAGMALIAIASAVIGAAVEGSLVLLSIGFLVMGAGLAVPYASAPRLALSALSPTQTGQGSGIVNACTFLGGSVGVAGGAIASALGGFGAALTMIALAGIIGAALSRRIPKNRMSKRTIPCRRGDRMRRMSAFGTKRTSRLARSMSAFDPMRTWAAQDWCCANWRPRLRG